MAGNVVNCGCATVSQILESGPLALGPDEMQPGNQTLIFGVEAPMNQAKAKSILKGLNGKVALVLLEIAKEALGSLQGQEHV
jgi:hypothetical protein